MKRKTMSILGLILLILDLLLKKYASIHWQNMPGIEVIPNFFYLTYVENPGAAWGMLSGQRTLFIVLTCFALYWMFKYLEEADNTWKQVALVLMIAGALGNFYDRLFLAYVRDMLSFYIFSYSFPVFNLADSYLTIGVVMIIIEMIYEEVYHGKNKY